MEFLTLKVVDHDRLLEQLKAMIHCQTTYVRRILARSFNVAVVLRRWIARVVG